MVVLDATIVNIALPHAQAALGFSNNDRQWIVTGYSLAFGSLLLLGGRIADLFGRKRVFIIGVIGFAAASAFGGAAQNFGMLLTGRVIQGAFGALLAPATLSLLTTTFRNPVERTKAMGIFGGIAGAGASVGLLLGGVLTEYLDWRYVMYVNVLIAAVALVGAVALLKHIAAPDRPKLDLVGTVLAGVGLFAIVYGFSNASMSSGSSGWTKPATLVALIGGAVLLAVFVVVERRVAHPLLPLRVILDRNRAGAYLAMFFAAIGMFGVFLFLTYYLEENLGVERGEDRSRVPAADAGPGGGRGHRQHRPADPGQPPLPRPVRPADRSGGHGAADQHRPHVQLRRGRAAHAAAGRRRARPGVRAGVHHRHAGRGARRRGRGLRHGQRRAADRRLDRHLAAEHDRRGRRVQLHHLARLVHRQRGRQAAGPGERAARQLPHGVLGGGRDLRRSRGAVRPGAPLRSRHPARTAPPSRCGARLMAVTAMQTTTGDAAPRRPRADAARNRQRLIDAAAEVFAARGLDATLDDIARHAGVNVATAYRHFANKQELAREFLRQCIDRSVAIAEEAAAHPDPWTGLTQFLERSLEMMASNRALVDVLTRAHGGEHFAELIRRTTAPLDRLLARCREAGVVRADIAATDFAPVIEMLGAITDRGGRRALPAAPLHRAHPRRAAASRGTAARRAAHRGAAAAGRDQQGRAPPAALRAPRRGAR